MKKLLKAGCTVLTACILMTGCGGNKEADQPVATRVPEDSSVTAPVPEETKAPPVTQGESLVYEGHDVKVTVKGMEEGWMGTDFKLLVENNSDRNIALSVDTVVVNGVTMNGFAYIEVSAGKKANGVLTLYTDSLETAGIDQIGWLRTCDARIVDTDSFATLEDVYFEIETSLGRDYVQQLDESGDLLYESEGIQVIAKVLADEFYGKTLVLYVKNDSDKDVFVQAENISVNGFTLDAWLYDFVGAGTVRFCDLALWESGLEENGIEAIEDVTFTIQLIDPESYETLGKSDELRVSIGK